MLHRDSKASHLHACCPQHFQPRSCTGAGNRKVGRTKVLYDPSYSERGVLLSATRAPRAANPLDFEARLSTKDEICLTGNVLASRWVHVKYMSHSGCSVLQLPLVIKTPHALPMYREDQGKGRKRPHEREADEAVRTRRPDPGGGIAGLGLGKGGKLGATGGTLLTQYILQNQVGRCTLGGLHASLLESGL